MRIDPPQQLFLLRHGKLVTGTDALTPDAEKHLIELADRFTEWMDLAWRDHLERRQLYVMRLTVGPTGEVATTARRLTSLLPADRVADVPGKPPRTEAEVPGEDLGVEKGVGAYDPNAELVADFATVVQDRCTDDRAPVLVANAPLVEWVAFLLVGRRVPIDHGELVCLERATPSGPWRVSWTLSADKAEQAGEIREKIRSKAGVATALGAVITGLLTFVIKDALGKATLWDWGAAAALATSAILYFASLFLFDTLQMPSRFWSSRAPRARTGRLSRRLRHGKELVSRPPSSTARLLHAAMQRVWFWIFLPASLLVGVGVTLLAVGSATRLDAAAPQVHAWQVFVGAAGVVLASAVWVAAHRPDIGSAD